MTTTYKPGDTITLLDRPGVILDASEHTLRVSTFPGHAELIGPNHSGLRPLTDPSAFAAERIDEIRSYFGPKVTRTLIRMNVRLAEAPSYGKTILQYDHSCRGARDFLRLAKEMLGQLPESEEDIDPGRPVRFEDLPPAIPPAPEDVRG